MSTSNAAAYESLLRHLDDVKERGRELRKQDHILKAAAEMVTAIACSAASLRGVEVDLDDRPPSIAVRIDPAEHEGAALIAVHKAVSSAAEGVIVDVTLLRCCQHADCIQHPRMGRDCYTSRWLCQDHEACRADPSIARDCLASRTPGPMPEPLAPDTTTAR